VDLKTVFLPNYFMKGGKSMQKIIKKLFFVFFISLFFVSYSQAFDLEYFSIPKVKVLDQNMYLGADLSPIFLTKNLELIPGVIEEIIASNYPARAAAVAKIIKKLRPDVVCLQEAWIFELSPQEAFPQGISWDFKALLLDALGDDYKEVETNGELLNIDLLTSFGVKIQDQDVIIARKHVEIGDTETIRFGAQLTIEDIPEPIGDVTVFRGLSIARLKIRGKWYTIANTHLEAFHPAFRLFQAEQVVDELNGETEPIILAGDFNEQPDSPDYDAYDAITDEFDDAWPRRLIGRRDPGFTFGRYDLISDDAVFDERIDFVFTRNHRAITLVGLTVGKSEFSKTDPVPYPTDPPSLVQLWPSDHLGLFFTLILPQ
jgi:endonuclease/exonuclease/phosphatase family metal-dependent hydrolase